MNIVTNKLTKIVGAAFKKNGYNENYGLTLVSNRRDLGQFQCNGALASAKEYKKNPLDIANEVLSELKDNELFSDVNVVRPGFINITLKDEVIVDFLNSIDEDNNYGIIKDESKTIVIDYGGPNIAKPLHVGHLRSAIIGDSIKRIARIKGHHVIGDIHLGDWGLQMGLVLAQIEDELPSIKDYDGKGEIELNVGLDDLNEWYPKASKRSKEDEVFRDRASLITFKLQNKDPKYYNLWKEIAKLSTTDLKKSYDILGVEFDKWLGESDSDEYVDELITSLEEQGLLYESDGAMVVDVAKEDDDHTIPPVLIKKSNGGILYPTTDLATLIQRDRDFNPDYIYYVVDNRQGMHFEQVFRCARKANLIDDKIIIEHVGFGTMNGSDGKPYKTRQGGILKLSDLISTVIESARDKIQHLDYESDEKELIAKRVGIAALKFGDLINFRGKDYLFDLDRFLSFEGKTGPYLLYTVSRINSILDKAKEFSFEESDFITPQSEEERDLMLNLLFINDAFENAFREKAPNFIADYVYNLAASFNKFYVNSRILAEEDESKRGSWLKLLQLVKNILELQLSMLGIDTVTRM
ncbi:TPA: arginine--tRNA ligase [bacterium]|nr:arginine--tRNA ligase [bacterium]